ncbi:MAG: hypothetical protein ABW124_22535 [Candidatus Thiodiazotropha sp. 6PLUC9]
MIYDENFSNMVMLIDWRNEKLLKIFNDNEYSYPFWSPDGNLMLVNYKDDSIYRADISDNYIGEPIRQLTLPDIGRTHSISPDGTKLAFQVHSHIWTVNMDGTDLKNVTIPSTGYERRPVWSKDSRYLIAQHSEYNNLYGHLFLVASDAENIKAEYGKPNIFSVKDNEGGSLYIRENMIYIP